MNSKIKEDLSLFFNYTHKSLKKLQNFIKIFEILFSIFLYYFTRTKLPKIS